MPEPWDRQDGEGEKPYSAFVRYRDLGPSRSLIDAYRQHTGRTEAAQPSGLFHKWAKGFRWKDRALAWDRRLSERHAEGAERQAVREGAAWEGRKLDALKRAYEVGQKLLAKAELLADFPVHRVEQKGPRGALTVIEPIGASELRAAASSATSGFELMMAAVREALPPEEQLPDGFDPATEDDPARLKAFIDSGGRRVS
jgi:hypothetical protein